MAFMPYIHFSGTCAEAMAFYADIFGGTDMMMMRYDESPTETGMPKSDRIMHAQFNAGAATLMASDYPPGMGEPQQAMSVMIDPATLAEGQRVFDRLCDGGAVVMPFGPTFWSPGFGMVKDRFGTHWIIGTQPEAVVAA
jgi:PhnB protein